MAREKGKKVLEEIAGVDISNDSIKVVVGAKEQDKIIVSHFAYKKLSPKDDKEPPLLAHRLKELFMECGLEERKIRRLRIYSVISGSKVCVRVIKLPFIPKDEIPQAVKAKIKDFVSYPMEEIVFDFSVLGEAEEKGVNKLQAVFIAIQKKDFYHHLEILKAIGIAPHLITSPCFCGWNLIKAKDISEQVLSLALVSIEYSETDISVFCKGELVFTRNIPFGSRNFIEALKNELNLPWKEAENIIEECGLSVETLSAQHYKISPAQIKEVLTRQAEIIFKEIELTSHHYYQITHGESIAKYILSGEATKLKGISEFLRKKLDLPVEKMEIAEDKLELSAEKKAEFKENALLYYQTLGALLASPKDINLVSFGQRKGKRQKIPLLRLSLVPSLSNILIFAFIFLAMIIFIFLKGQNIYYRQQIRNNQVKRERLKGRLDKIGQLKRELGYLDFKKKVYQQLTQGSHFYPEIIMKICRSIPEQDIFLEKLEFSKQPDGKVAFTLIGRIFENSKFSPTSFMLALEKTGYFENLSLATSRRPVGLREEDTPIETGPFTIKGELSRK